jgi:hypothetical protein
MKNIHIIPTDKPSRLHNKNGELGNYPSTKLYIEDFKGNQHNSFHIYITSDEEIKEGDYVCASGGFRFVKTLNNDKGRTFKDDGIVSKQNPSSSCHLSNYKKIILTTDQDLIKDGVQAIDDEFLEWFVKNPSCEEVKVKEPLIVNVTDFGYKIIIPKEEPKQETLEEAIKDYIENTMKFSFNSLDTKTQANRMLKCAEFGAKWQAERMYSEEEVINFLGEREDYLGTHPSIFDYQDARDWFEQFKKK